ncbi:MAG: hypothetical protein ABSE49_25910 [Polyangiaceae bacterium]|jgi:hypothetical protein
MHRDRFVNGDAPRPGLRMRGLVAGGLTVLTLFVLLSACDAIREASAPSPDPSCLAPRGHCEWDNQCCSLRCYHDTGCSGGTP